MPFCGPINCSSRAQNVAHTYYATPCLIPCTPCTPCVCLFVLTNHQKCRRQMRIRRPSQSGGTQGCTAQSTCHASQGNNRYEGAQRRSSEPLTTATFARALRGRSARRARERKRGRERKNSFVSFACSWWKIICFSFGKISEAGGKWPRTLAADSTGSCFVFRGACKLVEERKDKARRAAGGGQGRRRILLSRGDNSCCYVFLIYESKFAAPKHNESGEETKAGG